MASSTLVPLDLRVDLQSLQLRIVPREKLPLQERAVFTLLLAQGGEFAFIVVGVALLVPVAYLALAAATVRRPALRISAAVAPLIAIPTTAGTGSEVGRGAILILDDHRKLGFHSWHLVPKAAICDPELTFGLPPILTAATGMDAIAHCMETFMAPAFNPPADGIGLDGLQRAWAHIERATKNGQDKEARMHLMSASMQGAMGFQKGLGCVHSLSHSLGGVNPRLHHGTLNAMFLPAVVQFNAFAETVQKENRLNRMAQVMGLASGSDIPQAIQDMNANQVTSISSTSVMAEPGANRRVQFGFCA